jgi:large subunit ribosomal protein L15
MQLHQLGPTHYRKSRKRIGRGGKKGTYSGQGIKGQKSRAGKKPRPGFAGGDTSLSMRLPKKRGAVGRHKTTKTRKGVRLNRLKLQGKPVILNLEDIKRKFKNDEVVSPKSLLDKKLIGKIKGRIPRVKILGRGDMPKKLIIKGCQVSKQAMEKIKKTV